MAKLSNRFALVDSNARFELKSSYPPKGDQPNAIESIVKRLKNKVPRQTLLGVTGSGKTFTMANVIAQLQRPALVLAHNKTLAAQLFSEFNELFPNNAVRYFVSYYDYYQPEAYVPATDTYIEKDASINDEIDKLRHATTKALLERRDVLVVSSVSCIYGLGDPQNYFDLMLYLEQGDQVERQDILKKLVYLQYNRNDIEFGTGTFRVRGDVVEICPASESERSIRIEFFGDEIEAISEIDRLTGKALRKLNSACIYPASHFLTRRDQIERALVSIRQELEKRLEELAALGKTIEAHRLEQRTLYDLELLDEMGFCPGIENYSRHLSGRKTDETPATLLNYFPEDFIIFVDESHVSIPQVGGMYRGDRSRKQNLVDHGFRLPSALDNRPLRFDEFQKAAPQVVYVSATPGKHELSESGEHIAEQIVRPTGLLDPQVEVRPASTQVDDFQETLAKVTKRGERALVTVLTKRMAEHLTKYYQDLNIRVKYLHSEIHTLDRVELIRGLREGEFDVLVGINLLREGLDLPEVSLVGIMDADKEGFLRSETSLIQTIGRAARNLNGLVILYADKETDSIRSALRETNRRRKLQDQYNKEHGIVPQSVTRAPEAQLVEEELLEEVYQDLKDEFGKELGDLPKDVAGTKALIDRLRKEMFSLAKNYEFEKAAVLRDQIVVLEKYLLSL